MTNTPLRCDIFCAVIDNFGDAGVCWRLAVQLATEHGWQVRLWIDDPGILRRLAPDCAVGPVTVCQWLTPWPAEQEVECADVVIEAFACDVPAAYVATMASRVLPPVWLNLEYLTAEPWVPGCHGLPSPHPRLPLTKYFFFPGFDLDTGGLLRERDYDARRRRFDEAAFRAEFGLPPRTANELTISLFSYTNPVLAELKAAWAASDHPVRVLQPDSGEAPETSGALSLHPMPFLPQPRYDELLWTCDLNFVRGEDSFVRAQWAGKPFVWQIYPQEAGAHLAKLEAFLAKHPAGQQLGAFWRAWNGQGQLDWPDFAAGLSALEEPMRQWSETLAARRDLASQLVDFCLKRL